MNPYSFLMLFLALLLSGCPSRHAAITVIDSPLQQGKTQVLNSLYAQLKEWQGVRYQIGGLNKRGIDCSGFVYLTYRDHFGIELPRTTGQQAQSGPPVTANVFQAGDLIFFKTGILDKHVGIYVEKGKFLHASTSKGVMLSKLSHPYWSSHYWKTIRIPVLR